MEGWAQLNLFLHHVDWRPLNKVYPGKLEDFFHCNSGHQENKVDVIQHIILGILGNK